MRENKNRFQAFIRGCFPPHSLENNNHNNSIIKI